MQYETIHRDLTILVQMLGNNARELWWLITFVADFHISNSLFKLYKISQKKCISANLK